MMHGQKKQGFTLLEMMISITITVIPIMAVAAMLSNGQRTWNNVYSSTFTQLQAESMTALLSFGQWGRRSNRDNYVIYDVTRGNYTEALPRTTDPVEVVSGEAVEFHYWDAVKPSEIMLNVNIEATHYALFYLENKKLKIDRGPYPPQAVQRGKRRSGPNVTTEVIADNVKKVEFSHTIAGGSPQGAVRIVLTMQDPETKKETTVMTTTLLRIGWPR